MLGDYPLPSRSKATQSSRAMTEADIREKASKSTPRDIEGALYGSRLVELPHMAPQVQRCLDFIEGGGSVLVEVGFDHGRRLHSTARLNPDWRVLGLEVRKQRVLEATARAERDGLTNVLAWRLDARTVFARVLPPSSVDVVEVLFPTPWWHPGLRRKRLLVNEAFVANVARVLRPGGLLYVATDVVDYAATVMRSVATSPEMEALDEDDGLGRRPRCGQLSRREWACAKAGKQWARYVWERRKGG